MVKYKTSTVIWDPFNTHSVEYVCVPHETFENAMKILKLPKYYKTVIFNLIDDW